MLRLLLLWLLLLWRLKPLEVEESRKRLELLGETCCCWLLFLLEVEGNPTNSQSTLSEAGSLLRPPLRPLEKAYLERLRILVRKLFILLCRDRFDETLQLLCFSVE